MCKFACLCDNMLQQRHSTCHNARRRLSHYIFFTIASSSSSSFHPFVLYAHLTRHAASLLHALLFFTLSLCTEEEIGHIKRGENNFRYGGIVGRGLLSLFHVTHMSLLEIYVNLWCSLLHASHTAACCCFLYILSCSSMDYSCFIAIKSFWKF